MLIKCENIIKRGGGAVSGERVEMSCEGGELARAVRVGQLATVNGAAQIGKGGDKLV